MKINFSLFGIGAFISVILLFGCSTSKVIEEISLQEDGLSSIQEMMIGSYDSSLQEREDSSYYNISLHMFPIWSHRDDGTYLYVEQALTSLQDRPYRQRVYKLEKLKDGRLVSHVYTLKFDSLFIGKWKDPSFFDTFGLSILDVRDGCEVVLSKTINGYEGSTRGDNCKSTLRGATYATSKVQMTENEITSWDQGFDANGDQVWGATKGPYIFRKLKE
ncbi:MAG: chromophore lyase CpcT/CpeT [Saprospiraceae bacterium]|nr:chromophore lyase CpcT/CpeT [Saprospiraceae bacterium]